MEDDREFEPNKYLDALNTMANEVQETLPATLYPLQIIKSINNYLYNDLGFSGNTIDYYDLRNSCLNQVIERRTGIPITLSLVYLEIAKRINFPMVGIGMPGHFLIRPNFEEAGIYGLRTLRTLFIWSILCTLRTIFLDTFLLFLLRSFLKGAIHS